MTSPHWTVRLAPFEDPDVGVLLSELDREMIARGAGPATAVHGAEFRPPSGTFLVMDSPPGALGCAGVRTHGADAEVKRMYVRPAHRRRGLAGQLLAVIEAYVRGRGISRVILETAAFQPDAIAFYEQRGFCPIPQYAGDRPTTRAYAKWLD